MKEKHKSLKTIRIKKSPLKRGVLRQLAEGGV